jgi:hypothetical protein
LFETAASPEFRVHFPNRCFGTDAFVKRFAACLDGHATFAVEEQVLFFSRRVLQRAQGFAVDQLLKRQF